MKNRIPVENHYLPSALEAGSEAFVEHNNHRRYHKKLNNLTLVNIYFGRRQTILLGRESIQRRDIRHHRLMPHQKKQHSLTPNMIRIRRYRCRHLLSNHLTIPNEMIQECAFRA